MAQDNIAPDVGSVIRIKMVFFDWRQFRGDLAEMNSILGWWTLKNPVLPLLFWFGLIVFGLPLAVLANIKDGSP